MLKVDPNPFSDHVFEYVVEQADLSRHWPDEFSVVVSCKRCGRSSWAPPVKQHLVHMVKVGQEIAINRKPCKKGWFR